ncbi:MAG: ABC transporter permease subunit [Actinomycetes bacterium]|jgi:putative spermidine/putrescine transport system permease protein
MSQQVQATARKGGGFALIMKGLPLAPFSAIFLFFFCWPIFQIFRNSLSEGKGHYGLSAYRLMFTKPYMHAFSVSLQLSFFSALSAGIIGAIVAFYVYRASSGLRSGIAMLSGVLANSGGVPLAFMFIAAFGAQGGIVTMLKKLGFDIYAHGFTLYSLTGLILVYSFFQIPLMLLVFTPALQGLRNEWHEASNSLGAGNFQFIRWVLIPVLFPAFLASTLLLFASAFSAFATARALTGGSVGLVPLVIGSLIDGNITTNQANLGDALAVGMVVVSAVVMGFYGFSLKWARR